MYDLLFAASPVKLREFGGKMAYGGKLPNFCNGGHRKTAFYSRGFHLRCLTEPFILIPMKQAAGVLNLSLSNHDYLYSSDRMAHAMGNGCLTYIDRHTGFGGLFGEDEAGFFSSAEEVIEQIERFRKFPAERAKTAERGWRHYHALFNETALRGMLPPCSAGTSTRRIIRFRRCCRQKPGQQKPGLQKPAHKLRTHFFNITFHFPETGLI